MSVSEDLEIQQGVDNDIAWDIVDAEGEPADLSGYSAEMQVRKRMDPESALLYEFEMQIEGSSVVLHIDAEDTYTLGFSVGKSSLILVDEDDVATDVIWSGTVRLRKVATRI